MKNKNLFVKIVFAVLIVLLLLSLVAPAIFSQTAPRQEKLLNGLKVLMWSDPKSDKVSLKVRIHSGSAFDPQGKEGVMKLLAANIFPNPAVEEFFKDDLGGSLKITSNYDYIQVDATAKADQFLTMLETIATAVANPTIDKETTAKLKTALLAQVDELEKQPAYIADRAAAKRLLGTFPYGRPEYGSVESVKKIDFADLIEAKQRFLTADNATIAVSGKFDSNLAYRAIRRFFGAWLKSDKQIPSTFRQPDDPPAGTQTLESPTAEAFEIRYALRGTARSGADYAATQVLAAVLEGRLKLTVPVEYASGISVQSEARILPGVIVIRISGVKSGAKIEATDIIAKAVSAAVTDAEFQAAKTVFLSDWNKRESADRWLDVNTFKTAPVVREQENAAAVSLVDVQRVLIKLQKQPMASVLVNSTKAAE